MSWHHEILPADQQKVLRQLGPIAKDLGFFLGGGTAVAIYLGHRLSLDLDWFTAETIADPLELARDVQARGVKLHVSAAYRKALHAVADGVRLNFLESGYLPLSPPVSCPDFGWEIAALDDLAAMKLLAVAQRGTKKDFVDIHALVQHGLELRAMLECYRKKFSVEDVARVVFSLCYFDDAESAPMPRMLVDTTWEDVKRALRQWIRSIAG